MLPPTQNEDYVEKNLQETKLLSSTSILRTLHSFKSLENSHAYWIFRKKIYVVAVYEIFFTKQYDDMAIS